MRSLYILFLSLALFVTGYSARQQFAPGTERKNICVVNSKGIPTAVEFRPSLTLRQAIKGAGINRKEIKDRVYIFVKLDDDRLNVIHVNLKKIEQRRAEDLVLPSQSLVQVLPKRTVTGPSGDTVAAGCLACGCKRMSGMHGPFFVPASFK